MATPLGRATPLPASPGAPGAAAAVHPSEHFGELDVLRGLAAIAVVLFHFTTRYEALYGLPAPLPAQLPYGYFGVDFFFAISGFVIVMTLARCRRPMDFLVSRFSRLYPAYWVAVLMTFGVLTLFPLPGREASLGQMLVNLTMWQELFRVPHVDEVYWSLQLELIFYVWMFGLYRLGQLGRIRAWVLAWLLLALAMAGAAAVAGREPPYILSKLLLLPQAAMFGVGIAAHEALRRGAPDRLDACVAVLAVVCAGAWHGVGGAVTCAITLAVFGLFLARRLRWICARPLMALGGVSYTLYLVHQNIGYAVMREVLAEGGGPVLAVAAALAISVAAAALLTAAIERPAMQWIRERHRRPRSRD